MPRSRPRHDHDAGGPAELLAAKAELRQEIWAALRAAKAARFPGPDGRIPNFVGAEAAAERLRGTEAWHKDRKSTRLNSSHSQISYAVFCLKKKKKTTIH